MDYKKLFEQELQDIYLGKIKDIKGDGGYVNLIKIKSQFYNTILEMIKVKEGKLTPSDNPEEFTKNDHDNHLLNIYEHIHTFFGKYLNDTGTPFYANIKAHDNTYAQVYKKEDVSLFWKTQDLYYVKSERLYDEMSFTNEIDTTFIFNVDDLKRQSANEKLTYKYMLDMKDIVVGKDSNDNTIYTMTIRVMSNKSDKDLFDSLYDLGSKGGLADFKKEYLKINKYYREEDLLDAIRKYKKQAEVDYFIHKNAKQFLEEQLDLYVYNTLGRDITTSFNLDFIRRIQQFRELANTIIDCMARFENELKAMWEKPKLVKNSNYIITLDKLSSDLVDKIQKESPAPQKDEWLELGFIDEQWKWADLKKENYSTLPVDTKYLSPTLKYDILASIDNLDEQIDGVLIKSDNYQALKTLQAKYEEKIDLIYIDPPFNTGQDFAYKDGFQDSTWLTLMENRLELAKNLLSDQGSFYLHLDYRANFIARQLLDLQFGAENFINEIIWSYNSGGKPEVGYGRKHDTLFLFSKYDVIFNSDSLEITRGANKKNNMKKSVDEDGRVYFSIMSNGKEYKYYEDDYVVPSDVWEQINHLQQKDPERVSIDLKNSKFDINFSTQKPEKLLERVVKVSSNEKSIIMDYFSGSGTTINTAHKLGRKWIGVEMGEHFYSVILPRVKKTLFGVIRGISKELQKNDALKIGGFVKYYELESYDDILNFAEYNTWDKLEEYLIWDEKLAKALVFNTDNTITFDFSQIGESYQNFANDHTKYSDIAETLSNLFGAEIISLNHKQLVLKNIGDFDLSNLNFADEKVMHLKKLIWWESIECQ